ncbi:hypothetical protein FOZ62_003967, partial [Perkinsus olseni]
MIGNPSGWMTTSSSYHLFTKPIQSGSNSILDIIMIDIPSSPSTTTTTTDEFLLDLLGSEGGGGGDVGDALSTAIRSVPTLRRGSTATEGNVDGSDNNVLASAQRGGCYDETVTSTTTSPNGSDDNIIMTTTNDDGEDGIIPESVYPVLENVIASVELGINGRHSDDGHDHDGSGLIDLKKVAFKARNAEYNPR